MPLVLSDVRLMYVCVLFCGRVLGPTTSYYFFFLMIRRPPRSTLDRSSAASDVYKRQLSDPGLAGGLSIGSERIGGITGL